MKTSRKHEEKEKDWNYYKKKEKDIFDARKYDKKMSGHQTENVKDPQNQITAIMPLNLVNKDSNNCIEIGKKQSNQVLR